MDFEISRVRFTGRKIYITLPLKMNIISIFTLSYKYFVCVKEASLGNVSLTQIEHVFLLIIFELIHKYAIYYDSNVFEIYS